MAESVTVLILPAASTGSLYSTVTISPCRMQWRPLVVLLNANCPVAAVSVDAVVAKNLSFSFFVVPPSSCVYCVVPTGHFVLYGPSVYLTVKSSSKIPASGEISLIGPISLVILSATVRCITPPDVIGAGSEPLVITPV